MEAFEEIFVFEKPRHFFYWSHIYMMGIDPEIITYRLNIDPKCQPIKQKRRIFNTERYMAINAEVDKLNKARFIREANNPVWISNVVLVSVCGLYRSERNMLKR